MSMKTEFSNGDRVYLEGGEVATYICRDDDGHIVRPEIENGDETYLGTPMLASRVFSEPAKDRIEASIAALRAEETDIRTSLIALRREVSEAEAARKAQLKDFERYPSLARLTDFIEGRITHVVRGEYGNIRIQTFQECFEVKDDYKRPDGLKLVSLLGKPWNGIEWHMNHYKDGSGSYEKIVPCTSYEDAKAKAQEWVDEYVKNWRADGKAHWLDHLIKSAAEIGLTVPADLLALQRGNQLASAQEREAKLLQELAGIQARVAELTA
jgi:hypothetical protein